MKWVAVVAWKKKDWQEVYSSYRAGVCYQKQSCPQIQKYIHDAVPSIKHYYDVWHVAKGALHCITPHFAMY